MRSEVPNPQSTASAPVFLRLNIGCGSNAVPGWVNCDASFRLLRFRLGRLLRLPRYRRFAGLACVGLDARKPLPFAPASANAIYEQHMLYAFDASETLRFFQECHRVLAPGGVLRVNEDDLRAVAERHLAGDAALVDYVRSASHIKARHVATPGDALSALFKDWASLRWLYDAESLSAHLRAAGFPSVERCGFRQSRIPGIELLEKDNRESVLGQVWLEAVKPT